MTMTLRRRSQPEIVDSHKVERLGRLKGLDYVRRAGREFYIGGEVGSADDAPPGTLLIRHPHEVADPETGQRLPVGTSYKVAHPLPVGAYDQLLAQRRRPTPRMAPADALEVCSLLRGRTPHFVPTPGVAEVALRGTGGYAQGRQPIRGAPGIVAAVERTGAILEDHGGAEPVVVTPGGKLPAGVVEIAHLAAPLLLPYMRTGKPPACEFRHKGESPEAVTVTATGDVLMCEGHRSGELER